MAVSVWTRVDVMADRMRVRAVAVIGAGVEPAPPPVGGDRSTWAPMTPQGARRTVWRVGIPYALRTIGIVALVAIVVSIFAVEPKPALSGDGLWVSLSLAGLVAGAVLAMPWREMTEWRRLGGLTLIGAASVALAGVQPDGAGSAAVYVVVVVAAMRLPIRPALAITALIVGGEVLVTALFVPESGGKISGLLFSVIPWFLFIRLMRQIRESRDRA